MTLRTSSLSLLAECGNTNILSLLPYSNDLSEAMVDLLQTESVPAANRGRTPPEDDPKGESQPTTTDSQPMSINSKLPPLRRAALHFLSLLFRATAAHAHDSPLTQSFSMKRAKVTLAYVASTDEDMVVRVMAQEAVEELKQLGESILMMRM